jgi:Uma2 family endonuclease
MPATALVTSEQYLALPDEFDQFGNRIKDELIGGEIVKMPFPSNAHDRIKNQVNGVSPRILDENAQLGIESNFEIGAHVSPLDVYAPDVNVVQVSRFVGNERIMRGAPEAIEVVLPSVANLKAKIDAYLANGSHSVWVFFPESRSVIVHRPGFMHELKADEHIEDPFLPRFPLPVSVFFKLRE